MLRIQKKYVMPLRKTPKSSDLIPGVAMSFSSYPGVITSGDDFYLISSGLATLETTIGNGNASLWRFVQPKNSVSDLKWPRASPADGWGGGQYKLFQKNGRE